jgi:hypothetical protein
MLKECVSDHGHERMTMEALPGSSLEMIMTNLPHISWVNCVVLAERQAAQEKPCHDKVIRSRSAFVSYLLDTKALPGRELASVWRVSQTIMS